MARAFRVGAAALICILVVGCTVAIVEDYDPVLDQGLTSYQADIAAFLAKASANAGAPEGEYANADVQEFYARSGARLQSFVDRAEALDEDGRCLPVNFVGKGIQKVVEGSAEFLDGYKALPFGEITELSAILESFGDGGDGVSAGNCTVVIVKVVKVNQELLRLIHKDENKLAPIVAQIAGATIAQGVRIAIKNEVLKKRRSGVGF